MVLETKGTSFPLLQFSFAHAQIEFTMSLSLANFFQKNKENGKLGSLTIKITMLGRIHNS